MSRYQIDKLLRDLRREPELAGNFRRDAETVMDRYQIDEVERDLLKRWEIRELYDRGVNPLLLLLAHGPVTGQTMLEYTTAMNRILK